MDKISKLAINLRILSELHANQKIFTASDEIHVSQGQRLLPECLTRIWYGESRASNLNCLEDLFHQTFVELHKLNTEQIQHPNNVEIQDTFDRIMQLSYSALKKIETLKITYSGDMGTCAKIDELVNKYSLKANRMKEQQKLKPQLQAKNQDKEKNDWS